MAICFTWSGNLGPADVKIVDYPQRGDSHYGLPPYSRPPWLSLKHGSARVVGLLEFGWRVPSRPVCGSGDGPAAGQIVAGTTGSMTQRAAAMPPTGQNCQHMSDGSVSSGRTNLSVAFGRNCH